MLKKLLGVTSAILFILGMVFYIVTLFGNDNLLLSGVAVSAFGFILALFAEKGVYKKIGLIGNAVVIVIAVVFPFIVTTFFWNEP